MQDGQSAALSSANCPSCMLAYAALITGVGLGSMYGLLALGFHVTYAVSNTVNFAQGSTMMLGSVLCFTFWVTLGWPLALAIPSSFLLCPARSLAVPPPPPPPL